MEQYYGYFIYLISLATMGGIYAVLALGLNVQWGFTGLFNAGIAGFFAVGAYTQALLTTPVYTEHLGGYEWPIPLAMLAAMGLSAVVAFAVAKVCIRLRSDYLAIATIGIAEIIRLVMKNESWATNGPRGVSKIPKAFDTLPDPLDKLAFLAMVLALVAVIYLALERARTAPWGRVMTAIRENETAAAACGKNVERFRLEAFVIGAALMGLGGALVAQYLRQIDPQVSDPLTATFLVWVMLIAGGSGNNRGAILGAMALWTVWSATEILTIRLPEAYALKAPYVRIFLIGLILQIILQRRPEGILPEIRPKPHPRIRGARAPAAQTESTGS
ncbi:MAG TPA: branched-chain amino acid ABC transporter permease [Thermohalobaculum sp.]|nr:branched-chain amino acid ABC transporter permease [Thermohalobaculum sp.]